MRCLCVICGGHGRFVDLTGISYNPSIVPRLASELADVISHSS